MLLRTIDKIGKRLFGDIDKIDYDHIKKMKTEEIDMMIKKAKIRYEKSRESIIKKTRSKLRALEKNEDRGGLFWRIRKKIEEGKIRIEKKKEENILLESKNLFMKSLILIKEAIFCSKINDITDRKK